MSNSRNIDEKSFEIYIFSGQSQFFKLLKENMKTRRLFNSSEDDGMYKFSGKKKFRQ